MIYNLSLVALDSCLRRNDNEKDWISAFAGMTNWNLFYYNKKYAIMVIGK